LSSGIKDIKCTTTYITQYALTIIAD